MIKMVKWYTAANSVDDLLFTSVFQGKNLSLGMNLKYTFILG